MLVQYIIDVVPLLQYCTNIGEIYYQYWCYVVNSGKDIGTILNQYWYTQKENVMMKLTKTVLEAEFEL